MAYRIFVSVFLVIVSIGMVLLFPHHVDTSMSAMIQYRETFHLERGGQAFAAQGVMQKKLVTNGGGTNPMYGGGGVSALNVRMQPIPIPVGEDDYVFALHVYPYAAGQRTLLLYDACGLPVNERGKSAEVARAFIKLVASLERVCPVPSRSWPILIHFADRKRPETAERLFPADLESRFGVKLLSVSAERTDDPPTQGIERLLPWATDPKALFQVAITTVEEQPRSRPILLTIDDFVWPAPGATLPTPYRPLLRSRSVTPDASAFRY